MTIHVKAIPALAANALKSVLECKRINHCSVATPAGLTPGVNPVGRIDITATPRTAIEVRDVYAALQLLGLEPRLF